MMTNPRNPLMDRLRLFDQQVGFDRKRESDLVLNMLKHLGKTDIGRDMQTEAVDRLVTLEQFNAHAGFPMTLAYWRMSKETPIHASPKYVHPVWFKSFTSLPIVEHYAERYDEAPKDKPFGLVFPRKGMGLGLVMHNGSLETFVPPSTACHFYQGGGQKNNSFVVQPLPTLLLAVKTMSGIE